jgi:predicted nucleic acid-binding protein
MPVVIDASITMAWCFEDEASDAADAVLEVVGRQGAMVPVLWFHEVANVLVQAERRGRITGVKRVEALEFVDRLPVDVGAHDTRVAGAVAAAQRHGLTAYDAAYLTLAEREGLTLATLDATLADAARRIGIKVLPA